MLWLVASVVAGMWESIKNKGKAFDDPALSFLPQGATTIRLPMSPPHRRALTLSIGLAALPYLGFVRFAARDAVLAALRRVGLPVLLAIFALSLLNYLLRFWRWQHYVAAFGHAQSVWRHFLYYLAGFTLTVTPGKAGEAVRSLYLHQYGVTYA